jgi:hypothetical protein
MKFGVRCADWIGRDVAARCAGRRNGVATPSRQSNVVDRYWRFYTANARVSFFDAATLCSFT